VATAPAPAAPPAVSLGTTGTLALAAAALGAAGFALKGALDTPSRPFEDEGIGGTVGAEYDAWTDEGVLEHYWGEHIHLGYYTEEERAAGYKKKDFVQAKYDFVDEMLRWSGLQGKPARVLDCGCGIGGTTRHLGRHFGEGTRLTGITLSPSQVRRATELAEEQGVGNVDFQVMNALSMDFEDDTFDLVWACESGEHMPDKKAYVEEMTRVLKPGGTLVIATWCQREETPETPFSDDEKEQLKFLYEEWAHPYFVSVEEYERLLQGTGAFETVAGEDWVKETIDSWRHSIWVGVWSPWFVIAKGPRIWYKTVREIVTLERMHRAFDRGLMQYGMIKGTKQLAAQPPEATPAAADAGAAEGESAIKHTQSGGTWKAKPEAGLPTFADSLAGVLGKNGNHATVATFVGKVLADELDAEGPLTFFAPEDDAWGPASKALQTTKLGLMTLPELPDVLKRHVVEGLYSSNDLSEGMELTSLAGTKIAVGAGTVNGSKLKKVDFKASNGVYHTITDVFVEELESAQQAPEPAAQEREAPAAGGKGIDVGWDTSKYTW